MLKGYKLYLLAGLAVIILTVFWFNVTMEFVNTPESMSLVEPKITEGKKDSKDRTSVKLKITNDLDYILEEDQIDFESLEERLLKLDETNESDELIIALYSENAVPVNKIVQIMDIANRNKFKVILAVNPD